MEYALYSIACLFLVLFLLYRTEQVGKAHISSVPGRKHKDAEIYSLLVCCGHNLAWARFLGSKNVLGYDKCLLMLSKHFVSVLCLFF